MFATIVRYSASRPLVPATLALAGACLGVVSFTGLERDVFPDLSTPVFNVIVQNAALGAEELETSVAVPLESALTGLPGARRVRSSSQLGVTQVTVEFDSDADYARSRQLVTERVAQVAPSLPAGTEPPLVSSLTGRLNEILEVTLEAEHDSVDLLALRDLAENQVRVRLLAVPGVAAVERMGGYLREVHVLIDPDRMSARGVTLSEVEHAVVEASSNSAGGVIVQGPMEWGVRAMGRAETVEELRETVVSVRGGTPVLLGDVADVRDGPAVRRGMAHRLAGEIVDCRVSKQFGADTVDVARGVRGAVEELQRALPPGVKLQIVYDQSELVESSIDGVGRAVLLGAGFVVLVLLLLLGSWRAALLVTLTLPLSIGTAFWVLDLLGIGLNTMTLGGLAIAVGLLVDASIIVVEAVMHRLAEQREPARRVSSAIDAAASVASPIAFATLVVIAVFAPLFAMTGIEGRMFGPLAAAVIASLAVSFALALTFTPSVASRVLRAPVRAGSGDTWLIRRAKAVLGPALALSMRHAGLVRGLTLLVTVPALALAPSIGSDFMPEIDEGALLLQTTLPPEASLDEVDRANHRVEDVLRRVPEVADVVRRTGRSERTEDPMPHTVSDVLVLLRADRARETEEIVADMRERLERVPGISTLFTTPLGMRIDEGLGGTPADVSIRVFGPDLATLGRLAERARQIAVTVPGLADVRAEGGVDLPQIHVRVDRAAAARAGLAPGEIVRAVHAGLVGDRLAEVWRGQVRHDVVLRLADHRRSDLASIRGMLLDGHDGARVPLGQVAVIEQSVGPGVIRREAGMRRMSVEASVVGRDLASTAAELRARLDRGLTRPSGYFVDVGGKVEQQARATRSLIAAIAIAIVAVLLLLYLALGSVADTLVVVASLPDAFVGAVLALWLSGGTWNVSSLVGLIGLFGIAVQNGLVLVSQTRALVAAGRPFTDALREASLGRVRPKLLTAGCAILGLLPLLVLPLHGTEIERPLATVMIGGLVTSTFFTLLALPTFYALAQQLRERFARRR